MILTRANKFKVEIKAGFLSSCFIDGSVTSDSSV